MLFQMKKVRLQDVCAQIAITTRHMSSLLMSHLQCQSLCVLLNSWFFSKVITLSFLSVSSDHDSEGKRVQDMLSAIDKPQVGMRTSSSQLHRHTNPDSLITALINHLLSDAVIPGTSIDVFSAFSSDRQMLTLIIITVVTYACSHREGNWSLELCSAWPHEGSICSSMLFTPLHPFISWKAL